MKEKLEEVKKELLRTATSSLLIWSKLEAKTLRVTILEKPLDESLKILSCGKTSLPQGEEYQFYIRKDEKSEIELGVYQENMSKKNSGEYIIIKTGSEPFNITKKTVYKKVLFCFVYEMSK